MNCPHCDGRLESRVSFCPHCGYDLRSYFSAMAPEIHEPAGPSSISGQPGLTQYPLFSQIKQYIVFVVAACFIYSLFSVTTIRAGTENRRRTDGMSIRVPVTGINLLTGSFPNFTVKEYDGGDAEITTKASALAEMQPKDRRLVRTPWLLRTGYWVLTFGVVLLVLCRFALQRPQVMYPVARACGLLGSFAVIWVMGDVNRFADRFGSGLFGRFHLSAVHSVGIWGLLICFLFLFAETLAQTFRMGAGHPVTYKKQFV